MSPIVRRAAVSFIPLVAAAFVVAALFGLGSGTPATAGDDEAAGLYAKKCQSCHGPDGHGNAKLAEKMKMDLAGLDLLDEASLAKSDAEWIEVTKGGAGKMPKYEGKLTEEQIAGLTEYVRGMASE